MSQASSQDTTEVVRHAQSVRDEARAGAGEPQIVQENQTSVMMDASTDVRPEREATAGSAGRWRRRHRGERLMVPKAEFTSYYGQPVLHKPTWEAPDIAGYLFLGGLAGASSIVAAGAELTGRPALARAAKAGAMGAVTGSLYALIHDLGRPARFVNMLRVFKPTSPMSVGSWLLSVYGTNAAVAAATTMTGLFPKTGRAATLGAAVSGAGVATYTAALISNTAVPAWHDGYREMPLLFAGSAATAAAGLGLMAAPLAEAQPVRRAAVLGAGTEYLAMKVMQRRMGKLVAEPYRKGASGALIRLGGLLSVGGAVAAQTIGRRSRVGAVAAGAALVAGSACTRFGLFHGGVKSSEDPKYTVRPQRDRLESSPDGGVT